MRGEGRGEGRLGDWLRRALRPAPHPNLLPAKRGERDQPAPMTRSSLSAALAALFALVLVLFTPARADQSDKGVIADLISRALSSPSMTVSIGAVEGVLSSDVSIHDIVLADRDGAWLKVDKVRLIWNRLALFSRRLEVDQLTIGHIDLMRRPVPSLTPPPANNAPAQPILPELPLKVIVKQLAVDQLQLGEPVIGLAARLNLSGQATLGPPSEGLDLRLELPAARCARRIERALELRARDRQADGERQVLGTGRRHFRPSRQSSGPARGEFQFPGRGAARQVRRQARLRGRPGRLGEGRRHRRPRGRGAASHPRPELPHRRPDPAGDPAGVRWRDDVQGRRAVQRQFQRLDTRPAPRVGQCAARHRGDEVGRRHARRQDSRRRDSGRDRNRQARPQHDDRRACLHPHDRRRLQRRKHPRGGGLARARSQPPSTCIRTPR